MPGVHGLQQVKGFAAANLSHDYSVRAMAQGGTQKIADGDWRDAVLFLAGLKADKVGFFDCNFGGVFKQNDAFAVWDKAGQDVKQCCLSGAGAAADENVVVPFDASFQQIGSCFAQGANANQILHRKVPGVEFTDGESDTVNT